MAEIRLEEGQIKLRKRKPKQLYPGLDLMSLPSSGNKYRLYFTTSG